MNTKNLIVIFFLLSTSTLLAQTQLGIIKDPKWNVSAGFQSVTGSTLRLSDRNMAMIVNMPEGDFAVTGIDDKLNQSWLSPLSGFPLGFGLFKDQILVVAAADKSFFKNFSGAYKAYLLDKNSGKLLSEKIIYTSNPDFIEEPELYFAKDGSYFRMSVRLTAMKRKVSILAVSTSDKAFRNTQGYSVVNFDDQMNQRQKIQPQFPDGETWTASNSTDGSLFITVVNSTAGKINAGMYTSTGAEPISTVSIPLDLKKGSEIQSIRSLSGAQPFINYLSVVYVDQNKEVALLTTKINFANKTFESVKEAFDSKHVKMLEKAFVAVNKKYDDLQFSKLEFLSIKHMQEFENNLLVSVAPGYEQRGGSGAGNFEGSILINVYDQDFKSAYHQFIPRTYMSVSGEGSEVSYSLSSSNTLRMVANVRPGSLSGLSSVLAEMNFKTGQMLRLNRIPGDDVKSGFYVHAPSVIWLNDVCILPYFDRQRVLRTTRDVQLQLLKY